MQGHGFRESSTLFIILSEPNMSETEIKTIPIQCRYPFYTGADLRPVKAPWAPLVSGTAIPGTGTESQMIPGTARQSRVSYPGLGNYGARKWRFTVRGGDKIRTRFVTLESNSVAYRLIDFTRFL